MKYKVKLKFTMNQAQFADVEVNAYSKQNAIDKAVEMYHDGLIQEEFLYDGEVRSIDIDIEDKLEFDVGIVKRLHPLLNPDSLHYQTREYPSIWYIEKQLTVEQMIGACRFSSMKYAMREKGQDESDRSKILTYQNYMNFLRVLDVKGTNNLSVREIIDKQREDIVYSEKDL